MASPATAGLQASLPISAANSNPTLITEVGTQELLHNEQGLEAYYSFALTPWALLTPDVQLVFPAQKATLDGRKINPDTVLGLRFRLVL